jgi:hypothetical protein
MSGVPSRVVPSRCLPGGLGGHLLKSSAVDQPWSPPPPSFVSAYMTPTTSAATTRAAAYGDCVAEQRCPACDDPDVRQIPGQDRSKHGLDTNPAKDYARCMGCKAYLVRPSNTDLGWHVAADDDS